MRDCKHGQLARSCETCALEARIAELATRVQEARLVWGLVCECSCAGCTGFDKELTTILKDLMETGVGK